MQRQNSVTIMDVDDPSDENLKRNQDSTVLGCAESLLLGSITTSTLDKEEKGLLIRSSARVIKKMKLEQELDKKDECNNQETVFSPNAETQVVTFNTSEKSIDNECKGQPLRCSARVTKKVKQEPINPSETKIKKDETKNDIKKETRKWSYDDKIMFFEAVNEYGKDFENIQQYINNKLKKKGASEEQMRTKEHVRQFYIRTFHEISKHVKFSDGVKKVVQELYGVINYGELYKKLGAISEKACMKLNELIYRGETIIRSKGKTNRVKTPMCRALVKLNQLDEKYQEVKLPNRVSVDLKPKDMNSYVKVQLLAQNPRVRTTLPIQKRVSSLIECLTKRWKSTDSNYYEKSVISNNPITSDCAPSKEEIEEKVKILTPKLRLSPPPNSKIELPSINVSEYLTRQTICLTAYESRLGLDTFKEIKAMSKKKKSKSDTVCDMNKEAKSEFDAAKLDLDSQKTEESLVKIEDIEINCYETEPDSMLAEAVDDAVNTILSLKTIKSEQSSELNEVDEFLKTDSIKQDAQIMAQAEPMKEEDLDFIESIRKGWTELTSGSLTIGEVYLMYGCDSKLVLEYSWEGDVLQKIIPDKPKRSAANFLEMWNESFEESWEMRQRNLSSSLSKLLSLAKLHYKPDANKCPCGHVCTDKATRVRKTSIHTDRSEEDIMEIKSDVPVKAEGIFRTPKYIQEDGSSNQAPTMQQQLNSLQKLKPKFVNKKGKRLRQKPIVVERKLPLLPNNTSGHQIVRMSMRSKEPSVTSMESAEASTSGQVEQEVELQKVITDPEDENSVISTVPSSPSRFLKDDDEWINAEVADYSLSSLLGHLESPIKSQNVPLGTSNTTMASDVSHEVDAQLQSLMMQNSMDFAANFADLAASVVNDR